MKVDYVGNRLFYILCYIRNEISYIEICYEYIILCCVMLCWKWVDRAGLRDTHILNRVRLRFPLN